MKGYKLHKNQVKIIRRHYRKRGQSGRHPDRERKEKVWADMVDEEPTTLDNAS